MIAPNQENVNTDGLTARKGKFPQTKDQNKRRPCCLKKTQLLVNNTWTIRSNLLVERIVLSNLSEMLLAMKSLLKGNMC